MLLLVRSTDHQPMRFGLELRAKKLGDAVKGSQMCNTSAMVQAKEEAVTRAALRVLDELHKREGGLSGMVRLTDDIRLAWANAVFLWLTEVDKMQERAVKTLGTNLSELIRRSDAGRNLHDRLTGTLEIWDDAEYDESAIITAVRVGDKGVVEMMRTTAGSTAPMVWKRYRDGAPVEDVERAQAPEPDGNPDQLTIDELAKRQEAEAASTGDEISGDGTGEALPDWPEAEPVDGVLPMRRAGTAEAES